MRIKIKQALHLTLNAIALTGMCLCVSASAQNNDGVVDQRYDDWFQVEVIVFARNQVNAPDVEKWSKNVALAYPPNLQLLLDAETASRSETDNSGTNNRLPPLEQPFVMLSSNERTLNNEALQIKRNRGKRVLFHEAWRQPMLDKDSSPAIVINGGDSFDKNKELEGTITIWLSRYLHMSTNLWLSTFEANYGQETEHWPYPPEPPTPFNMNESMANDSMSNGNKWELSLDKQKSDIGLNFDNQSGQNYFQDYTNLTKQPYVVSRVVTMQQRRRMRSTELHYLDHPLMGVLIQIDRFDPKLPNN